MNSISTNADQIPVIMNNNAIAENSTIHKVFTCIPYIGYFYSTMIRNNLRNRIKPELNISEIIGLIKLLNIYKTIDVINWSILTADSIYVFIKLRFSFIMPSLILIGLNAFLAYKMNSELSNNRYAIVRLNRRFLSKMIQNG